MREVSQSEVKFSAMPKGANLPDGRFVNRPYAMVQNLGKNEMLRMKYKYEMFHINGKAGACSRRIKAAQPLNSELRIPHSEF